MNDIAGDVRVVTWNLHGSAGPDLARVASELRAAGVELAGLQELRAVHARRLARMLGWNVRWVFKHFPMTPLLWWRAEGMAILTRFPITASGDLALTADVSTWSHRRRVAQWCELDTPIGPLRVVNVHLASSPTATAERVMQARTVLPVVHPGATVLTGDLNAAAEPELLSTFASGGLRDAWCGPGPGHTNPAGAVRQRLDYVLVADDFEVVECCVPVDGASWAEVSDHLPVHARLARRALS